jgi:curved DNA-binding protein CbpA
MQIMVQSNYEILEVREDATRIEIRDAFRKLVLEHHSDRGGDDEQFKKIKQAFDDLKLGKKFPDSPEDKNKKSRFYYEDSEEEKRKKSDILREIMYKGIIEKKLEIALKKFQNNEATASKASEIAGIPLTSFLDILNQKSINFHYTLEDLREDLED